MFKVIEGNILDLTVDAIIKPTYDFAFQLESDLFLDRYAVNEYQGVKGSSSLTEAGLILNDESEQSKYTIYVVGPHFYKGRLTQNIQLLKESYLNCLHLATKHHLKSIAFPLISAGGKMFPKKIAFEVAKVTIENYLKLHDHDITLVVYDVESILYAEKYLNEIHDYLDQRTDQSKETLLFPDSPPLPFHEQLMNLIRSKKIQEVTMYKTAFISKAYYHKIITGKSIPSRKTVLAMIFAMRLSYDEALGFLHAAGYQFSASSHFDLIIEYHVKKELYDFEQLDHTLYQFTEETLRKYD